MKVTMKDVAKLAGVSVKSVSRIVNSEYCGKAETREKIEQAIATLHYIPSKTAQCLASDKMYNIGLAYDNPNAYYIIDLQTGLLEYCQKSRYDLFILPCNSNHIKNSQEFLKVVLKAQLAGLVLTPPFSENTMIIKMLKDINLPFVRIVSTDINSFNINEHNTISSVFINDQKAAFNATQYLIDKGHQQIAFLGGNIEHLSSKNRLLGYQNALFKNNINSKNSLILEDSFTFNFGVKGATQLLNSSNKPTAIIAANDEIAAGAIVAAQKLAIKVPESLAIIGFENSPFSLQTFPALTTLEIPIVKIASLAAKLLIELITDQQSIKQVEFTPKMIIRHST